MNRTLIEKEHRHYLLAFGLLVVGLALRAVVLPGSLWLDEIWSAVMSAPDRSLAQIIEACKGDTHPPFFDLLLHYHLLLFGDEPIQGRILAMLIGMMGMVMTYYFTWRISGDRGAGLLALGLLTFSYFHMTFSAEGRFYTLLYLLSLSLICRFYLYFKEGRPRHMVYFVITAVVAAYTHYYGAILLLALGLIMLFLWARGVIEKKPALVFILSSVLIIIAFAPWLPHMFSAKSNESWMSPPNVGFFFEYLYGYTGKNPVECLFGLVALLLSVRLWKTDVLLFTTLYGTILLGFLIPLVVSLLSLPMLHFRYTFIYYPSIVMIIALFWSRTEMIGSRAKTVVYLVVVLSILANLVFLRDYFGRGDKAPWERIAQQIGRENARREKAVYTDVGFYLDYYLQREEHPKCVDVAEPIVGEEFFYLTTDYSKRTLDTSGYRQVGVTDYGDGFVLYEYARQE